MLFQFVKDEQPRIAKLEDNRESCLEYWDHYKKLTPWEGVLAGYWICASDKRFIDDYLEDGTILYPVTTVARKSVGNGGGKIVSFNPDCIALYNTKLFYSCNDMKIEPDCQDAAIPQWVEEIAMGVKLFSKGLQQVETEIIQLPGDNGGTSDYYAVTFFLDNHGGNGAHLEFQLAGEYKHLLPLTYVKERTTYLGTLGHETVFLDVDYMVPDWETDEYKWL